MTASYFHEPPTPWQEHAACIGHIDVFSPTFHRPKHSHNGRHTPAEQRALAICHTCPVATECLDAELALMREGHATAGVFGATTAHERNQILKGERT